MEWNQNLYLTSSSLRHACLYLFVAARLCWCICVLRAWRSLHLQVRLRITAKSAAWCQRSRRHTASTWLWLDATWASSVRHTYILQQLKSLDIDVDITIAAKLHCSDFCGFVEKQVAQLLNMLWICCGPSVWYGHVPRYNTTTCVDCCKLSTFVDL